MPAITVSEVQRRDLIASIVQETLKQKSIILPSITDYSNFAEAGAKQVSIPKRTQFAAADKVASTALTSQAMSFTADVIPLTKHKAVFATVERIADLQSAVNVEAQLIQEMAEELALQLEKDLYIELKLASASTPDHRIAYAGAALGQSDILESRRLLNIANVPMSDRFLLINPDSEKAMLSIADFVRADSYGNANGLANGELGRIYGLTVLMSNVVEALGTIVYHKSAVGYASQMMPEFKTAEDLPNVQKEYLLNVIYGSKVLDAGKRQVLLGSAV